MSIINATQWARRSKEICIEFKKECFDFDSDDLPKNVKTDVKRYSQSKFEKWDLYPFSIQNERDKPGPSPAAEQLRSPAAIVQEMDDLYVFIRGALYANALGEAKKAFQERNFAEAFRLVRETGELYRRMHLQAIKLDPEKAGGGKKEDQKLREKQAKIKDVLDRFDGLDRQLEKMAKLQPDKPKDSISLSPQPAPKTQPVAQDSEDPRACGADDAIEQGKNAAVHIIDMGSFTQLQTAAQLTGLLPNADGIGFVRDHEFKSGKFQEAFERIDAFFMHLKSAAEGRQRTLRQEEHDYKSGILKMSPKQWLIKQQTDAAQTQKIDRALRYCTAHFGRPARNDNIPPRLPIVKSRTE